MEAAVKMNLDKDVDLSQYFSKQEMETMSSQQQKRLKTMAQNYEIMLYMGLPAFKPDFMRRQEIQVKLEEETGHESVQETKAFPVSDSDETWTPDTERKINHGLPAFKPDFMRGQEIQVKLENVTGDEPVQETKAFPVSDIDETLTPDTEGKIIKGLPAFKPDFMRGQEIQVKLENVTGDEPVQETKAFPVSDIDETLAPDTEGKISDGLPAFKPDFIRGQEIQVKLENVTGDEPVQETKAFPVSDRDETWTPDTEGKLTNGLPAFKPDFMRGQEIQVKLENVTGDEPVQETKAFPVSDIDETLAPDTEGKIIKEEEPCPSQGPSQGPVEKKAKMAKKVDKKLINELIARKGAKVMDLEPPDDDSFLYCGECDREYDQDCPVHGPLEYIRDTEIYTEYDPERALHTLPSVLVVKESRTGVDGLGVFTEQRIPPRVMFGPYGGVRIDDKTIANDSGYCWQIYVDGKPSHFVDGKDKASSNWMRYINCAPNESVQNLEAFQFKGDIYYRSYKTIYPGTELLCWFGNEYGRQLGFVRDKNLLIRPEIINGQERYPCVFCKASFTQAVSNVNHLKRVHATNGPLQSDVQVLDDWLWSHDTWKQCDFCDYTSNHYGNLQKHVKTHTGEKPYKCDFCSYACSQKCRLTRHLRTHTGDKCFKCDICEYATTRSCTLKAHKRIHTGEKFYKCHVCGYACNDNSYMKKHVRMHTGEKPYKCDLCSYASNQSGALKKHIRTHTGERCYKCSVCEFATKQSGDLKRHMEIHTLKNRF